MIKIIAIIKKEGKIIKLHTELDNNNNNNYKIKKINKKISKVVRETQRIYSNHLIKYRKICL